MCSPAVRSVLIRWSIERRMELLDSRDSDVLAKEVAAAGEDMGNDVDVDADVADALSRRMLTHRPKRLPSSTIS